MASYFFGIVDGTGSYSDADYTREMRTSFCRQLFESNGKSAHYLRGPSGEGYYIERRATAIVDEVMCRIADTIYLAGYSRGGSIAVIAARMLAERGRNVAALFLFDPVARHGSASSEFIPANVASAYVARRAIGAAAMDKYDYTLLGDLAGHNPARNWFGTTATGIESQSTKLVETVEVGSHGALGGVGWRDVTEDAGCQANVAKFFNEALRGEGLPAKLVSHPPSGLF